MDRKVTFTLSIGISNAEQKEIFTLEELGISEDDYQSEEELEEILNTVWRNWALEQIDGGVDIE